MRWPISLWERRKCLRPPLLWRKHHRRSRPRCNPLRPARVHVGMSPAVDAEISVSCFDGQYFIYGGRRFSSRGPVLVELMARWVASAGDFEVNHGAWHSGGMGELG